MAVNKEGTWMSNVGPGDVNAVTWGAFPAKEIIQPTVVDPSSFMVWKDEAFEIWSRGWASLYPEDDPSRKLLEQVRLALFLLYYLLYVFISGVKISDISYICDIRHDIGDDRYITDILVLD